MAKKNKAYITGIAGFVGSHLAEYLINEGWDVYGLAAPKEKYLNIRHIRDDIDLEVFSILNESRLKKAIKKIKPDYIFHLAAFSSVGRSFTREKVTYEINIVGTQNVFSAAEELKDLKKLVFVSSADCYGDFAPKGKTLTEEQDFNPMSPYAVSKTAGEYMAHYHRKHYGLPVVIARPFNHTGPRQSEAFVVPSFCRQVVEIERGRQMPVMQVGNLAPKRDLSDVRDIVRGYKLAAEKGKAGEVYQFCSGQSVAIKSVLANLLKLSKVDIKVTVDKNRYRKSDIPVLRGNYDKAKRKLGWKSEISLSETLSDTLDYWRMRIKG